MERDRLCPVAGSDDISGAHHEKRRIAGSGQGPRKTGRSRPLCRRQPVLNPADSAKPVAVQTYWQAWFDGAALPNPGKIGVGVLLVSPEGQRSETSRLMPYWGCNNEAELYALCLALDLSHDAGARHLVLRGDSNVGLSYVRGSDVTKIERLLVLVRRARESLRNFKDVQMIWIPRHRNGEADRLSRQALGLAEKQQKITRRRRRA